MKRIIMLAMVLVVIILSIGGCFIGRDVDDHHGKDRGHDDRHDKHDKHGDRH